MRDAILAIGLRPVDYSPTSRPAIQPRTLRDRGRGTISSGHCLTPQPGYANIGMYHRMKDLTWLADSRSRVKLFPAGIRDDIGYALYAAQLGERSPKSKPLHGLGGQVMQIAAYDASGTYRESIRSRLENRFT